MLTVATAWINKVTLMRNCSSTALDEKPVAEWGLRGTSGGKFKLCAGAWLSLSKDRVM